MVTVTAKPVNRLVTYSRNFTKWDKITSIQKELIQNTENGRKGIILLDYFPSMDIFVIPNITFLSLIS